MQAGTSAPGGLVDLVVKRPLDAPLRSAFLEWRERGSVLGAVDISQRFGADDAFGVRLNAGAEHIDPIVRNAKGNRNLLALAGDWRASAATLIEAEIENSHRSQPSVPGFSLLGDSVPAVADPHLNLNNQPWSLPVVFDATTGVAARHAEARRRLAPRRARPRRSACAPTTASPSRSAAATRTRRPTAPTTPTASARTATSTSTTSAARTSRAAAARSTSRCTAPPRPARSRTTFSLGVQRTIVQQPLPGRQAFNFAGTGNVDGTLVVPPAPDLIVAAAPTATSARPSSALRDAIAFGSSGATAWLGARHTQLDAQRDADRRRAGHRLHAVVHDAVRRAEPRVRRAASSSTRAGARASRATWRRTCRSTPRPCRRCRATPTPARRCRRPRAGRSRSALKGGAEHAEWSAAAFDIRRPLFGDIVGGRPCGVVQCTRGLVGEQRHRASRAAWRGAAAPGACAPARSGCTRASRSRATRRRTARSRPTCPPSRRACRATGSVPAIAGGLRLLAAGTYESAREVLPDNSVADPERDASSTSARATRRSRAPAPPGRCAPASTTSSTGAPGARAPTSSATSTCSRSSRARCASRCRPTSEQAAPRGPPAII